MDTIPSAPTADSRVWCNEQAPTSQAGNSSNEVVCTHVFINSQSHRYTRTYTPVRQVRPVIWACLDKDRRGKSSQLDTHNDLAPHLLPFNAPTAHHNNIRTQLLYTTRRGLVNIPPSSFTLHSSPPSHSRPNHTRLNSTHSIPPSILLFPSHTLSLDSPPQ